MPAHIISHRIDTVLELYDPFEMNGFNFEAWDYNPTEGSSNGWLATKEIIADTFDNAFLEFNVGFHKLVDQIAFVGQCHTTIELEPFLIARSGDDKFFWRYSRSFGTVPLHFNSEEVRSLKALENYNQVGDIFLYMREAVNATSFNTMLTMLVSALEAAGGGIDAPKKEVREYIANNILKDAALCDKLFKYREGIRNQILHGGFIDLEQHGETNYTGIVYDAIIDYFNENYGLKIDKKAVNRPRSLAGGYESWSHWCEWVHSEEEISLKLLQEKFKSADMVSFFRPIDVPNDI